MELLYMDLWWILVLVGSVSWFFMGLVYRYALANRFIDVPNERSSHAIPTPRGGGVAIVFVFLMGLFFLWKMSLLETNPFVAFIGAGLLVAIIGFMDDCSHIAARWRLSTHFCASLWLLFWLDGLPPLILFGIAFDFGWSGDVFAAVALVWLLNLYNFMDGIDGIAGVEALSSTLVAGLLFLLLFDQQEMALLHLLLAATVAGFLMWNFPPAKIFMGDIGSGFLGLMLGALALYSAYITPSMLWVWLILLGVFIVDATFTLFRRLLRGDKVYEAHCSHAYQYAARKYGKHRPVTLAVLAINLAWLAPWSIVVAFGIIDGSIGLLCAYVPLLWLAWYFHAGDEEKLPLES